jgi:hypothetical protein
MVSDAKEKEAIATSETPSSLSSIAKLWSILQRDQAIAPNDILPLATRILTKRETFTIGRDVVSKLAQRSLVRVVRGVLLRDEKKYQDDKNQDLGKEHNLGSNFSTSSKPNSTREERQLVGAGGSGLRRSVNGRSW